MRHIDFIVQSIILGATIMVIIFSGLTHTNFTLVLGCQLVLGCWQLVGCFVWLITNWDGNAFCKNYLVVSIIYLIALVSVNYFSDVFPSEYKEEILAVFLMAPSWGLGIYYYIRTCMRIAPKQKRSQFLPHINF